MVWETFKKLGMNVLSRTRYPKPLVTLINYTPVDTQLTFDDSATIEQDCTFLGEVTLDRDVVIGKGSHLEGKVSVGRGTYLVRSDELIGNVSVGNFCAIARDVTVQARDHMMTRPSIQMRFYDEYFGSSLPFVTKGPTRIGNDVWIGTGSIILSGVEIGDGAVVGAGSVVTHDVDPYAIVAGVPAENKKWRFAKETRDKLLDINWWDWDDEKILRNKKFFNENLEEHDDFSNIIQR
jgi:virginiamycin A acetyltransferase